MNSGFKGLQPIYVPWSSQGRTAATITNSGTAFTSNNSHINNQSIYYTSSDVSLRAAQALIPANGDWTMEMWFRSEANSLDWQVLFSQYNNNSTGRMLLGVRGDNRLTLFINGMSNIEGAVGSVSDFTWHHTAALRRGNTVELYLDGVLVGSSTLTGSIYTGIATWMGDDNYSGSRQFNGYQQEIRISNIARYNGNFTPHSSPHQNDNDTLLLLHGDTLADDDTSSTLLELQQPLTNRAYVETTAYGGVSVNTADYKTGYGSLEFSNEGYVELPSTFEVDHTKDFTYETWARCDNHAGYEGIITKWQANEQEFFLGLHTSSRAVMLWRNNSSNTRVDYTSSYVPAIGEWFHLAYAQQGNTSRLFINGVLYQLGQMDKTAESHRTID